MKTITIKKILIAPFLGMLVSGLFLSSATESRAECAEDPAKLEAAKSDAAVQEQLPPLAPGATRLKVAKLRCSSCQTKIEAALRTLPEVQTITTDLRTRTIDVTTAKGVETSLLVNTIKSAGYEATPVSL